MKEDGRPFEGKACHPSIKRIMLYIDANYAGELSIRGLAEQFDMNADYLSYLFKKDTGVNLHAYINAVRLGKAHQLLEKTDLRINEVAYQTGFANPGYFAEKFKETYGCTPRDVRRSF